MERASGDLGCRTNSCNEDGSVAGLKRIVVSELTGIAATPAFDAAVAKQRARMVSAASELGRVADPRDEYWS